MIIYKATNVLNGKIYIGQTIFSLEKRKRQHEKASIYKSTKHRLSKFDKEIYIYGKENFNWEIIFVASNIDELNKKEVDYILEFDSINPEIGYNMKVGGENGFHSEETKRKIGFAQMGEKNHMYGKRGKNNKTSKKCINLSTGKIYDSVSECAEIEQGNLSKIAQVCRGKLASYRCVVYRYIDKKGNIIQNDNFKTKMKSKKILHIETGVEYKSSKHFLMENPNIYPNKEYIRRICKGRSRAKDGYSFVFV